MRRAESWMMFDDALAVVMTIVVLAALFYSYPARADADKVGELSIPTHTTIAQHRSHPNG